MNIENKSINTLRVLSAEAIEKANSGHPGLPLGAAPMAYTLWSKSMKHNPKNPDWINRDRFVLSAGHGSALLYSLLHLFNYGLSIEDLKNFRQLGSKTPGHPEYRDTVGVEVTTGPLGQGLSNAVGMAMAERHLAETFNRDGYDVIDHYTFVLSGDGDMMEGIGYEATSLAGTLALDKLIVLYDSNSITIEGETDIAFTESVADRFKAQGWQVLKVEDGNNILDIHEKIEEAKRNKTQPTLIEVITEIGYGSPKNQGKSSAHGSPLGDEDLLGMKERFEWTEEEFTVPKDVREHNDKLIEELSKENEKWNKMYEEYKNEYKDLAEELERWINREIPMDYLESEEFWNFDKNISTREASGILINRLADKLPNLMGGSADLAPSNKTYMNSREDFSKNNYKGSNIRFGVREHAMAGILNGLALHKGVIPYGGTFLIFSDYMKHSMRLSALMKLPVTYVLTHDSIGVGEDGPTHQPIEQLAMYRSLPNFTLFRPADARETAAAWYTAMNKTDGPVGMALTRQNLPLLEGSGKKALKGGYILREETKDLDIILLASGSEVQLIYEAAEALEKEGYGVRVVSMPSFEIFESQSNEYKESVLPNSCRKRVAVEAATDFGWYKYVGLDGKVLGMKTFGASGPAEELFEKFGFTVENVIKLAKEVL
ncbi:MAG TPA: transketolase [Tissierellaceae bacterium]